MPFSIIAPRAVFSRIIPVISTACHAAIRARRGLGVGRFFLRHVESSVLRTAGRPEASTSRIPPFHAWSRQKIPERNAAESHCELDTALGHLGVLYELLM